MQFADIRFCIVTAIALPDFMTAIAMSCVARDWTNLLADFQRKHAVVVLNNNVESAILDGILHGVYTAVDIVFKMISERIDIDNSVDICTFTYQYGQLLNVIAVESIDNRCIVRSYYQFDQPPFDYIEYFWCDDALLYIQFYSEYGRTSFDVRRNQLGNIDSSAHRVLILIIINDDPPIIPAEQLRVHAELLAQLYPARKTGID